MLLTAALVVATLATPAERAAAQLNHPHLTVLAGGSTYDMSRSGTSPFGAVRIDLPFVKIVYEAGLGVFEARESVGGKSTYLIPEVQVQWQLAPNRIRPYIGVGGGYIGNVSGPADNWWSATGSASVGARVTVPATSIGFSGEVRVRGFSGGVEGGKSVEYALGLRW
jgi:hypothetical protein